MDWKHSTYWRIFSDVWEFLKKFYPPPRLDDESGWDAITDAFGEVVSRYSDQPEVELAKSLVLSVIDELDRVARREEGKGK